MDDPLMKAKLLNPYQNETTSLLIGDLTVENRLDRISLYGSLDITKDQIGLTDALQLKDIIDSIVDTLQKENNLPERIVIEKADSVVNPFL
ncbi:MAG: hypothetical protein WCW84_04820 [Sulfurimonas sp.]|jgi:hypothetical protein